MVQPLLAEGEFALVRQHLEAALQKSSVPAQHGGLGHEHDLYVMLADAAALQGDERAIRHYAPRAEELAARYEHRLYQAIAHRAWGVAHRLAGEYGLSEARLKQALGLFRGLDTRWQTGRTLSELAELAQARADFAVAREYFSRALLAFDEMEARPNAGRTRAALAALEV